MPKAALIAPRLFGILSLLCAAACSSVASLEAAAGALIPARFQGEWREDTRECGEHLTAALVISPTQMRYLEMLGEVVSVRILDPSSVVVVTKLAGRESRTRSDVLILDERRRTLRIGEEGGIWARCDK